MGHPDAIRLVHYPTGNLQSIGHLIGENARRGVYILEFTDGQRYVGQAVDVVRRYATHLRRWPDTEAISFCHIPLGDLNEREVRLIHDQQRRGIVLRNQTHALGAPGPSPLDSIVTESSQHAWLTTDVDVPDVDHRTNDPAQRRVGRAAYDTLRSHPMHDLVVDVLRSYVAQCLPCPKATEREFWALSCMPTTGRTATWRRLAALSINKMETCVVGEARADQAKGLFEPVGFVVVSSNTLEESHGMTIAQLADVCSNDILFVDRAYEAAGGDAQGIEWNRHLNALDELHWVDAARKLNLRLMRKGRTFQGRWHNFPLADAVLDGA